MRGPIRAAIAVALLFTFGVASPALAHPKAGSPWSMGKLTTYQVVLEPGSGTVGGVFESKSGGGGSVNPMKTWGSSYATSEEILFVIYNSKARAMANIWNGKRIIQVCSWYERPLNVRISTKKCSNAGGSGNTWLPGPEVQDTVTDDLDPNAPVTVFRYSIYQIPSNVPYG